MSTTEDAYVVRRKGRVLAGLGQADCVVLGVTFNGVQHGQ